MSDLDLLTDDEDLDDIEINLDELSSGELTDEDDEALIQELKAKEEERQKQEALIRELSKRTRTRLIQKKDSISQKPQSREKSNKIIKKSVNAQFKCWVDVRWNNDIFWTKMMEDLNLILEVVEELPMHKLKIYLHYLRATKKYEPWKTLRKDEKSVHMKKFLVNFLNHLHKKLFQEEKNSLGEEEDISGLFDELIVCDYWLHGEKQFYEVVEKLKKGEYQKPIEQKCGGCDYSSIDGCNFERCLDCKSKVYCRNCVKENMHLDNSSGRRCLDCKEKLDFKICEKCGYVMTQYYWTHHYNDGRCFCLRSPDVVVHK